MERRKNNCDEKEVIEIVCVKFVEEYEQILFGERAFAPGASETSKFLHPCKGPSDEDALAVLSDVWEVGFQGINDAREVLHDGDRFDMVRHKDHVER